MDKIGGQLVDLQKKTLIKIEGQKTKKIFCCIPKFISGYAYNLGAFF